MHLKSAWSTSHYWLRRWAIVSSPKHERLGGWVRMRWSANQDGGRTTRTGRSSVFVSCPPTQHTTPASVVHSTVTCRLVVLHGWNDRRCHWVMQCVWMPHMRLGAVAFVAPKVVPRIQVGVLVAQRHDVRITRNFGQDGRCSNAHERLVTVDHGRHAVHAGWVIGPIHMSLAMKSISNRPMRERERTS